ncbi:MAG: hypothetical protein HC904_15280 [Blastochloris sp.]|nr:hypothetical protein [Blastochloris sp.]
MKQWGGILLCLIAVLGIAFYFFFEQLGDLLSFKTTLDESWKNHLAVSKSTKGNELTVAVVHRSDTFEKSSSTYGPLNIYLGTTYSKIKVNSVTRYSILITDPWELHVDQDTLVVKAPRVRPMLPPAILTDSVEKFSESGWAKFDKNEHLAELEKNLTDKLSMKAQSKESLERPSEQARDSLVHFVKEWLIHDDFKKKKQIKNMKILFPEDRDSVRLFAVP